VTRTELSNCPHPLLRFHSPSEFDQPALPRSSAVAGTEAPSMGFLSLRRRQNEESTSPGLPRPVRSASRFSQPPSGLLLLEPRGSISPHRHPWDSVLQSVLLDTCRDTSPVPDALLTLPSCRSPSPRYLVNGGAHHVRPRFGRTRPCGRLQGFAHVASSFMTDRVLPLLASRCSPGLSPL